MSKSKLNLELTSYLAKIGREGGRKSRRALSPQTAQEMVRIREAKRLFKKYHAQCFWSYDKNYAVTKEDIAWVAEGLRKNGDRMLWQLGTKLLGE